MAEEPEGVVEAPASAPAGTATPAAEAPAAASEDLSPDQIIDKVFAESDLGKAEAPRAEEKPVEAKADDAGEAEAKEPAKEGAEEEPDERLVESEIPDSWKDVLTKIKAEDSRVAKQIKDEHYTLAQYREVGALEEVREIRKVFPTVQDAQRGARDSASIEALNYSLRHEPGKFLGFIAQQDPASFGNVAAEFPRFLHSADPELYADIVAKPAVGYALAWMEQRAKFKGNEILAEAVLELRQQLQEAESEGQPGPEAPLIRRVQEADQREADLYRRDEQFFEQSVDTTCTESAKADIRKTLDRLGGLGMSREVKNDIEEYVLEKAKTAVRADPRVLNAVRLEARRGSRDPNSINQTVQRVMAMTRPVVTEILRKRVQWAAKNLLTTNANVLNKEKQVSSQREPGAGAPAGSTSNIKDWKKMTAEEKSKLDPDALIDMAARGELRS